MSQISIGIDENTALLFEGTVTNYGHAVWPTPFVSLACYIGELADWKRDSGVPSLQTTQMLFREDFFDPVARVRRGRLYVKSTSTNPADWHVQQHPAYAGAGAASFNGQPLDRTGFIYARLLTFLSWRASDSFMSKRRNSVLVLGFGDRVAAHSILDVERLANGEDLITLRTRASIGVLPDLNEALIPEAFSKIVKEQYEKAANAAFRDDPESVIDRCREAAAAALNAERSLTIEQGESSQAKDLSDLATYFSSAKFGVHGGRLILSNAARIIARLHARTKSSERLNKGSLGASEGDGECALALLSTIYRELEWVF